MAKRKRSTGNHKIVMTTNGTREWEKDVTIQHKGEINNNAACMFISFIHVTQESVSKKSCKVVASILKFGHHPVRLDQVLPPCPKFPLLPLKSVHKREGTSFSLYLPEGKPFCIFPREVKLYLPTKQHFFFFFCSKREQVLGGFYTISWPLHHLPTW